MTHLAAFTAEGEERLALGTAAHRGHRGFLLISSRGPGAAQSLCRWRPWAELELSHLETSITHSKNLTDKDTLNLGNRRTGVRGVVWQVPHDPKTWPQPQSGKPRLLTLYIHI